MSWLDGSDRGLVVTAAMRAVRDGRWHCEEVVSREAAERIPEVLRSRARKLALSAAARDQLLAFVLTAAAQEAERTGAVGEPDSLEVLRALDDDADRLEVRRAVFQAAPIPSVESEALATSLESRLRPGRRPKTEMAAALRLEARLHELLWDHPRLPGDARTRLIMLFATPKLLARADAIEPPRARASSSTPERLPAATPQSSPLRRWLNRPVLGLLPQGWLLGAGAVLAAAATGLLAEG